MKLTIVKTDYDLGHSCDQCYFAHKTCPSYDGVAVCLFFDNDGDKYHFEQLL